MTKLSVNVNKLALLRNSREKNNPNLLVWGERILGWGAHGLTVHPRPDGRHVRETDVGPLAKLVRNWGEGTEFNIEGYPSEDFFKMIEGVRPDQCTLVPDPPEALTSNAGWDFVKNQNFLIETVKKLRNLGTRISLFLDPATFDADQMAALKEIKPDRIELSTESYAENFGTGSQKKVLDTYARVSDLVTKMGLGINAGHDLNQKNLGPLADAIPKLLEVSIGHALVCEALDYGFQHAIKGYLDVLENHGSRN
jgi:pyridoxine 5-phosphate synthase